MKRTTEGSTLHENGVPIEAEKSDGGGLGALPTIEPETSITPRMDGGTEAWLAVLGSWILFFNTWGLSNSFGVFQTYYSTTILRETSSSTIAWIGSIQTFLTMFTGVFSGWLVDSGRHRLVMFTGLVLEVFGMFMTSLGSKYWHFLLAQGICVGLGSGLLALTSLAILPLYFSKRRLLAGGIAATGSGLSGTLFPIMMRQLFVELGFGWAVRILAFLMLGTLTIAFIVIHPRRAVKSSGPLFRARWFKEPIYVTFVLAFTFIVAAIYVPCFFIEDYALGLGVDPDMAFYILSILNAATTVCRLLPNWLADKYGALNLLIPCCFSTALCLYSWKATDSLGGLIGMSMGWSIATGGLVSLAPLAIANLRSDTSESGRRIGLGYTIASIGGLVGNPIAGAAKGKSLPPGSTGTSPVQDQFQGVWFVAAGAITIATIFLLVSRFLSVGSRMRVKI
ncbi:MAG: hypothetical protein M4579_006015 [Chaenotheca gracillima]|nr:MAG: hypothetical protein M4579_006015 [Chaenotheca gracillima]